MGRHWGPLRSGSNSSSNYGIRGRRIQQGLQELLLPHLQAPQQEERDHRMAQAPLQLMPLIPSAHMETIRFLTTGSNSIIPTKKR